ncbi:amidase signature enzyme [Teratosphaeria nubilosa]|uniref:Amidase signature enzyme n=1 Tax=Teratosphaeria nubilosa TaxID=161662 RepID=A0A6G1LHQ6_9PEZI|nr:amidase signature enzyme [Teratosphaeria nubilosa]
MSVVALGSDALKVPLGDLHALGAKAGLKFKPEHQDDFRRLLGTVDQSVTDVLAGPDYFPRPDLEKYPRTDISIPSGPTETDKGGWATRVTVTCTFPTSSLLQGKTVALKDNVALAGVRCTNGTAAMSWTPQLDATITTRILDAGATITGKATCENACMEGVSDTSLTGPVHNPYADWYSAGGSSSGSGRLVATGSVDMAVGCDQGGSIRIPSSMCGIVGLKPTWGLVPYTGIISLEATIDHAGPMARNVPDAAKFLDAIAGPDGLDDRQPPFLPPGTLEYSKQLSSFLSSPPDPAKPLTGIKIGVLEEAFTIPNTDPNIAALTRSAATKLASLGAEVKPVSIPSHSNAGIVWMCNMAIGGGRQGLLSDLTGRKQLYLTDRVQSSGDKLTQEAFDALSPGGQNLYLRYVYLEQKYGAELPAKTSNLVRKMNDDYDQALQDVHVLVMPTLPSPPCKLFSDPPSHGPLERLSRNVGLVGNTAPFNSTGHPALTIPIGFVPALEDDAVMLPAGMQIVGGKWRDIECLKVGAAWEKAFDWKSG